MLGARPACRNPGIEVDLGDFIGDWRLLRRIDDRRTGCRGRLAGRMTFAPAGGVLAVDEKGLLQMAGQGPFEARRRYLWRASGRRIAVLFEDGRPFHDFDPAALRAEARHICGADEYRVRYDFARWPVWRALWEVRGPRKDYRLLSLLRPARACAVAGAGAEPPADLTEE